jgi:hypothetical protein
MRRKVYSVWDIYCKTGSIRKLNSSKSQDFYWMGDSKSRINCLNFRVKKFFSLSKLEKFFQFFAEMNTRLD